jgi:hypothetical protein
MAAVPLKHLLNHDDDGVAEPAHRQILDWSGDAFSEEYVDLLSCYSAATPLSPYKTTPFTSGAVVGSICGRYVQFRNVSWLSKRRLPIVRY